MTFTIRRPSKVRSRLSSSTPTVGAGLQEVVPEPLKALSQPSLDLFSLEGFAVASVTYRLARNGSTMRNCVIDSKDALRYLVKNSATLKIDPEQLFVFGDSAGGHIAQMLLLTPPDVLTGDPDLAKVSYQVTAGLSWYGPCDFEDISLFNHDDRPDFRNRFANRILGEEEHSPEEKTKLYREMSPVTYLKKNSPPLLMIQGDQDTTIPVKHAYRMAKEAEKLGAPCKNNDHQKFRP